MDNRIIMAVGKHVIAQDTLSGGDEGIGINESADFGIVISALEIIESGLSVLILAVRPFRTVMHSRGVYNSVWMHWVVFISYVAGSTKGLTFQGYWSDTQFKGLFPSRITAQWLASHSSLAELETLCWHTDFCQINSVVMLSTS